MLPVSTGQSMVRIDVIFVGVGIEHRVQLQVAVPTVDCAVRTSDICFHGSNVRNWPQSCKCNRTSSL